MRIVRVGVTTCRSGMLGEGEVGHTVVNGATYTVSSGDDGWECQMTTLAVKAERRKSHAQGVPLRRERERRYRRYRVVKRIRQREHQKIAPAVNKSRR